MSSDLSNLVQSLGGAVSSLFSGQGNSAQAKDFQGAASLATQNAQLASASTRIQETQMTRQVAMSLGTTQADISGAGFTESGSALDILKASASQGALAKSLVNVQGAINENSYAAQAGAYEGEAKAAKEASRAGTIGAIASVGGALISGTNELASAGKTVVQGIHYVNGLFAGAAPGTTGAATDLAAQGGYVGDLAANTGLSATDMGIQDGGALYDNVVSSGIGMDTSSAAIGSSADAVSSAVSSAFDSVSSAVGAGIDSIFGAGAGAALGSALSSFIPGLGLVSLVDMIPGVSDIPVVGPVLDAVSGAINDVANGVVSVVGDIGSAIGSVFGSVICTALYKRGMLTRPVWNGAQRYGRDIAPEHIYRAYLLWGRPIARAIGKSECFAKIVAPVFVPWAHQLAVLAGEKTAKSTVAGRVIFKVTYAFSAVLGTALYKRRSYATQS